MYPEVFATQPKALFAEREFQDPGTLMQMQFCRSVLTHPYILPEIRSLIPPPCSRVRGIVGLGQVLIIEVCVYLRGTDAAVPQQFLHGTQVAG